MSQTIECTVSELLERIRRGEIPHAATFRGTLDTEDDGGQEARPLPGTRTLREILGYEPEVAASMEELEADRAEFDQFYENLNETRRAQGMRTL